MTAPEPAHYLAPETWTPPVETEALFIAAVEGHAKKVKAAARVAFSRSYDNGDRKTFRGPNGEPLGMVYREDPDPEWVVHDTEVFAEALERLGAQVWEPVAEIVLPSGDVAVMHPDDELYRIVAEHAPHLTRSATERLRPDLVRAHLAQSRADEKPSMPGISKHWPEGRLVVRAAEGAGATFAQLMRAELISWDGRPVLDAPTEQDGAA